MNTPSSQQMRDVVKTLSLAAELYPEPRNLGMMEGTVALASAPCQTILCFAGAYGAGLRAEGKWTKQWEESHNSDTLYWEKFTSVLARALGFGDDYELRKWADSHPHYWLNDNGWEMFGSKWAFVNDTNPCPYDDITTLQDIVTHLTLVADTLPSTPIPATPSHSLDFPKRWESY